MILSTYFLVPRRFYILIFAFATICECPCTQAEEPVRDDATTSATSTKSPNADPLCARIDGVLKYTLEKRTMDLDVNRAWQILHGVLGYGKDFEILHGKEKINVLDWIFQGNDMQGWTLEATEDGLGTVLEQGSSSGQGHADQWIAIISQCGIPLTQPIRFRGKDYTVGDLIADAKRDCSYSREEFGWTLIAFSKYLESLDDTWTGRDGDTWSMERMLQEEIDADREVGWKDHVYKSACFGTHRMIGIQMAVNEYKRRNPGRELVGAWALAEARMREATDDVKKNQLSCGGFSADFARPVDPRELTEHIGATGHTLEFLTFALSKEELQAPWVVRGVNFLCSVLEETKSIDLESGGLYHAIHGLRLYRDKVYGTWEP